MAGMILGRVIKFFNSVRLTVVLLVCMGMIFFAGLVIPQKVLLGDEAYGQWKMGKPGLVSFLELFHLTEIYTAPWTLVFWGVFFLNLIVVMLHRVRPLWNRCRNVPISVSARAITGDRNYMAVENASLEAAEKQIRKKGYRIVSDRNAFFAVKNRYSPMMTVVFHLSFLLVLIGGVISFYTKFRAEADVAEGETFSGTYRTLFPPKIGDIPRTVFTIEKIEPLYYQKDVTIGLKVYLRTAMGLHVVEINRPYEEGRLSFIVRSIDIAPHFELFDERGKLIDSISVKLKVLDGAPDIFSMHGYNFEALFYTDVLVDKNHRQSPDESGMAQVDKEFIGREERRQKREVVNPAFHLTVSKSGKNLASALLKPGESISFNGYRLVFSDISYWADFYVGREYGLGVLYAGFALMTAALVVRFGFYRREIRGIVEDGVLYLTGRGEFFPVLFSDEMARIAGDLRSAIK